MKGKKSRTKEKRNLETRNETRGQIVIRDKAWACDKLVGPTPQLEHSIGASISIHRRHTCSFATHAQAQTQTLTRSQTFLIETHESRHVRNCTPVNVASGRSHTGTAASAVVTVSHQGALSLGHIALRERSADADSQKIIISIKHHHHHRRRHHRHNRDRWLKTLAHFQLSVRVPRLRHGWPQAAGDWRTHVSGAVVGQVLSAAFMGRRIPSRHRQELDGFAPIRRPSAAARWVVVRHLRLRRLRSAPIWCPTLESVPLAQVRMLGRGPL